jgi:hypothetical protein
MKDRCQHVAKGQIDDERIGRWRSQSFESANEEEKMANEMREPKIKIGDEMMK